MDFSTADFPVVSRVPAPLLVVVLLQLIVIGAALTTQLYVLIIAGRYLHSAPWVSVLWAGIPHTLRHGQVLYYLVSPALCQDVYMSTLVCSTWMLTMLVLVNREDFIGARNIVILCLAGFSTVCLLWKYQKMEGTDRAPVQTGLFCRPARDMLPIFAEEYLTLYIPLLVMGIIPSNDVRPLCQECREWDSIQRHLLGLYACFLLILRPIQIYYSATLDLQYSDVFLSHVNLLSFLYVCMKTVKATVPAKQCSGISKDLRHLYKISDAPDTKSEPMKQV